MEMEDEIGGISKGQILCSSKTQAKPGIEHTDIQTTECVSCDFGGDI